MQAKSETLSHYGPIKGKHEENDRIIAQALLIIDERAKRGVKFSDPKSVGQYFCLHSHDLDREVFSAAFLDSQNGLLGIRTIAKGTINQATVYPREVLKMALAYNAASVIFHHNHPSGNCEPSRADEKLTKALTDALGLIDIRVLDHVITAGGSWYSFAEHGLI